MKINWNHVSRGHIWGPLAPKGKINHVKTCHAMQLGLGDLGMLRIIQGKEE